MPGPRNGSLLEEVVALATNSSVEFYELSLGIRSLYEQDAPSWNDLPKLTGKSRRRLYYLLDVGELISEHKLSKSDVEAVGWTKLQIVSRYLAATEGQDSRDVKDLLQIAATTKARDLREALEGRPLRARHEFVFYLTEVDTGLINETLLQFGAKRVPSGLANKENALIAMMLAAWKEMERTGRM